MIITGMKRDNALCDLHPVTLYILFPAVICFTMFVRNPLIYLLSFIGAECFFAVTKPVRALRFFLAAVFFMAFTALTNPVFSHNGATPLLYMGDLTITAESLFYGAQAGLMIISVYMWCAMFGACSDFEKNCYISGHILGNTAVTLTVASRLLKLIGARLREAVAVADANHGRSLRNRLKCFGMIIGWSLEHGIEMSRSMKAREYGKRRRRILDRYRFGAADAAVIGITVLSGGVTALLAAGGNLDFYIYPVIKMNRTELTLPGLICFFVLSMLPAFLEIFDDIQWKYYESKI